MQTHSNLLLRCLRDGKDDDTPALANFSPADWENLLQQAHRHNILPLLGRQLSIRTSLDTIPNNVRLELRQSSLYAASRNLWLYHNLQQVLQAFEIARIPVIVLKGAHLAELVYGDVALRPMSDIDLLVHKEDMLRCDEKLCEIGYGPSRRPWIEHDFAKVHHHLPAYTRPGAPPIEIHWSIVHPNSPVTINLETLWQRARPAQIASCQTLTLSPEDLLLHLCLHACHNRFSARLYAITDISETLRRYQDEIDWDQVQQTARAWGVQKCTYLNLYLAAELLNAAVPKAILEALEPPDFNPAIAVQALEKILAGDPISVNLARLWKPDRFGNKVRLIWKRIFILPDALASKYSINPTSIKLYFYYLVRIKYLIQHYSQNIWHTMQSKGTERATAERENLLVDWLSVEEEPQKKWQVKPDRWLNKRP